MCKQYGVSILVSGAMHKQVRENERGREGEREREREIRPLGISRRVFLETCPKTIYLFNGSKALIR